MRNVDLCAQVWAALSESPLVRISLFCGEAQATIQSKWGQVHAWITHKLPIPAVCTEVSAACSLGRGLSSWDAPSSAFHNPFSKHSRESFPSPILLSLTSSIFFLCSPFKALPGFLRDWKKGGKKGFENPLAREPQIYFWRAFFFFFFENKKPQGEIGNTGVKGVCFSFGQTCLLSYPPASEEPQLYGERGWLRRGRRSLFPAKPRPKTTDPHLSLVT